VALLDKLAAQVAKNILMTGSAGSGKSTLAERMKKLLDIPIIHLDGVTERKAIALGKEQGLTPKETKDTWEEKKDNSFWSSAAKAAVQEVFKKIKNSKKPHIIEGIQLAFKEVRDKLPKKDEKILCHVSDKELKEHLKEREKKHKGTDVSVLHEPFKVDTPALLQLGFKKVHPSASDKKLRSLFKGLLTKRANGAATEEPPIINWNPGKTPKFQFVSSKKLDKWNKTTVPNRHPFEKAKDLTTKETTENIEKDAAKDNILISGYSGSGKTTMAARLSNLLDKEVLSVDNFLNERLPRPSLYTRGRLGKVYKELADYIEKSKSGKIVEGLHFLGHKDPKQAPLSEKIKGVKLLVDTPRDVATNRAAARNVSWLYSSKVPGLAWIVRKLEEHGVHKMQKDLDSKDMPEDWKRVKPNISSKKLLELVKKKTAAYCLDPETLVFKLAFLSGMETKKK